MSDELIDIAAEAFRGMKELEPDIAAARKLVLDATTYRHTATTEDYVRGNAAARVAKAKLEPLMEEYEDLAGIRRGAMKQLEIERKRRSA